VCVLEGSPEAPREVAVRAEANRRRGLLCTATRPAFGDAVQPWGRTRSTGVIGDAAVCVFGPSEHASTGRLPTCGIVMA